MATELVYGRNPVFEVLTAGRREVRELLVSASAQREGRLAEIVALGEEKGIPIRSAADADFDQVAGNAQGVGARVSGYPYVDLDAIMARAAAREEEPFVLLLDVLQDPQNVATLLRTAEAVGVHGVVIPLRRAAAVTPAVVSASSGATEHLYVARENLAQAMVRLKEQEVWLTGLEGSQEARSLPEADLTGAVGLVVGSEGEGMRRLVRESCDFLVRIPMRGRIESLNAATAGSVALYAIWEARGYDGH